MAKVIIFELYTITSTSITCTSNINYLRRDERAALRVQKLVFLSEDLKLARGCP